MSDWIDDLARKAEEATPGPWEAVTTGRAGGDHWYVCGEGESIASISAQDGINEDQRQPDAAFIAAANPARVLRLIAENRDLSERLAQAYRDEVLAHDERDALAVKVAAVETLAERWAFLAGQAMDADTREWLDGASRDLRAALDTTTKEN